MIADCLFDRRDEGAGDVVPPGSRRRCCSTALDRPAAWRCCSSSFRESTSSAFCLPALAGEENASCSRAMIARSRRASEVAAHNRPSASWVRTPTIAPIRWWENAVWRWPLCVWAKPSSFLEMKSTSGREMCPLRRFTRSTQISKSARRIRTDPSIWARAVAASCCPLRTPELPVRAAYSPFISLTLSRVWLEIDSSSRLNLSVAISSRSSYMVARGAS